MQAILFIGLQAAGKSTFFKQRLFDTHVRVSLDLLRTRYREQQLLNLCLKTRQPFVVDNTNPNVVERVPYLRSAREFSFRTIGFYFRSKVDECLKRNSGRHRQVSDVAIRGTATRLEQPSLAEGFDELWYVYIRNNQFVVDEWISPSDGTP